MNFKPGSPPPPPPSHRALRAAARLMIGSTLTGAESLLRRLHAWEDELESLRSAPPEPTMTGAKPTQEEPFQFSQPPAEETPGVLLRYALVGWLMDNEERLSKRLAQAGQISRGAWKAARPWVRPLVQPLKRSPLYNPVRREVAALRQRGQEELERWVELGRQEELRSRDLARLASKRTVDDSLEYLAHNPEVENLVETQSTGLANEVVDEVRERTVSADTFIESLARTLLRRPQRKTLPEAPEPVRKLAAGFRADSPGAKKAPRRR